jgi:hypothetical protein
MFKGIVLASFGILNPNHTSFKKCERDYLFGHLLPLEAQISNFYITSLISLRIL